MVQRDVCNGGALAARGGLGMSHDETTLVDGDGFTNPARSAPLVMAIDDSPIIRTVIEHTLARVGIRVIAFADGPNALRALQEQRAPVPDLLLLDIDLPRMTGYEIVDLLRSASAYRDIHIVMLSGHNGILDKVRSRIAGAQDYIRKPFKASDLAKLVCDRLGIPAPASAPGEIKGE
jgi:twitching motility two-component system response regulator PilG